MSETILSCPMCDSESVLSHDGDFDEPDRAGQFWVECTGDDCMINGLPSNTAEEAIRRWNRRAEPETTKRLINAAREALDAWTEDTREWTELAESIDAIKPFYDQEETK
jgi:hypothetical protein